MESGLIKVAVQLARVERAEFEHGWASHEILWAKPLGGGLFEIRNIPWETDALHFLDVVRCTKRDDDFHNVRELVTPSGHTTLRLTFAPTASEDERAALLTELESVIGNAEHIHDDHWAVDVTPSGDLNAALEALAETEDSGVLLRSAHT